MKKFNRICVLFIIFLLFTVNRVVLADSAGIKSVSIQTLSGKSCSNLYLRTGLTVYLKAAVSPEDTADQRVVWKTSDENVVSVDSTGKLTPVTHGTAIITAASSMDGNYKDTCIVKVTDGVFYGDVASDNQITATDLTVMKQAVSGDFIPTDQQKTIMDLNGDQIINQADVDLITDYMLGNIFAFPVENMISKIEIVRMPNHLDFPIGEPVDTAGLSVKAVYNNGAEKNISDYTVSGDTKTIGQHEVVLSYTEGNVQVQTSYTINVYKPDNGIITGGDGSVQKQLSTGETVVVTLEDCVMTIEKNGTKYQFLNGMNVVGTAVVSEDDLLHFLMLSGNYYVMDLSTDKHEYITVYRNTSTLQYSKKGDNTKEVTGSSFIDSKYFYELRDGSSEKLKETLLSKTEFDKITGKTKAEKEDIIVSFKNEYENYVYNGKSQQPEVVVYYLDEELVEGIDYRVTYLNNINACDKYAAVDIVPTVSVNGIGDYSEIIDCTLVFTIQAKSLTENGVSQITTSYTYTGKECQPAVRVTDEDGTLLNESNYDILYSNHINAGTASLIVFGKNNYKGMIEREFEIKKADEPFGKPSDMSVSTDLGTLKNVNLETGWKWSDSDQEKAIVAGATLTATAVYDGRDKNNFSNLSATIKVTGIGCTHSDKSKHELRNFKEATCEESGYSGDVYCTVCQTKITTGAEYAPLGHQWDSVETIDLPATCKESGSCSIHCSVCGKKKLDTVKSIPALGHTGGHATCVSQAVCERCNEDYGLIDANQHDNIQIRNKTEATCQHEGNTGDTYCADCNKILVFGEKIEKLEHLWNDGVVTSEPTEQRDGVKTFTCLVCGEEKKERISKTEFTSTETTESEIATTETPRTETPTTETDRTEAPKTEAPRTETQTTEISRTEIPKTEAPRTEVSKTEAPRTAAPQTSASGTEVTRTEMQTSSHSPSVTTETMTNSVSDTKAVLEKKSVRIDAASIEKELSKKAFKLKVKTNSDGKLKFKSSSKKVAVVSEKGKVTMKGCGTAKITIETTETDQYLSGKKVVTLKVIPNRTSIGKRSYNEKQIILGWNKIASVSGYEIVCSDNEKFKKNIRKYRTKKTIYYFDKNQFLHGKTYYFKVRGYKKSGGKTIYGKYGYGVHFTY